GQRLFLRLARAGPVDRRLEPTSLFPVEFSGERDIGRLASGRFTQTLVGNRLRVNLSPDLSIASLTRVQDRVAPDWQAGIDARYALTPTTAVYGTLFPDFATIEAD